MELYFATCVVLVLICLVLRQSQISSQIVELYQLLALLKRQHEVDKEHELVERAEMMKNHLRWHHDSVDLDLSDDELDVAEDYDDELDAGLNQHDIYCDCPDCTDHDEDCTCKWCRPDLHESKTERNGL